MSKPKDGQQTIETVGHGHGGSQFRDRLPAWLLTGIYLALVLIPLVGFAFGCWQIRADISLHQVQRVFGSGRVVAVLARTSEIAAITALTSTLIGWWLASRLDRISRERTWFWLAASAMSFLLSPYVFTQGWIGWLGDYGRLWQWLGWHHRPFTIYSPGGVIAMLTVTYVPVSLVLVYISRRLFAGKVLDAGQLFKFSAWDLWRLIEKQRSGPGLAASLIWVFALCLWAYDVPSMLRQNLYALELMAAFGSFYDYGRALVLVLPPALLVIVLAALSGFAFAGTRPNSRHFLEAGSSNERGTQSDSPGGRLVSLLVAESPFVLFAIVSWVIPLAGLLGQIRGWAEFRDTLQMFGGDIVNTARNGVMSATIASALAFLLAGWSKLSGSSLRQLVAAQLPLLALPGSVAGIGLVYVLNSESFNFVARLNLQLVLVESVTILPLMMLLFSAMWQVWPSAWSETRRLFGWSIARHLGAIAWPLFRPSIAVMGALAFAMAIREVPASLLTYPPGGSTLAISIETLLHFDQPGKVATLCVIQLALLIAVVTPLFYLGKGRRA